MRSGAVQLVYRSLVLAVGLALAAGFSPARAQDCKIEAVVYVDKTESVNARETAKAVLSELTAALNVTDITLFGFAGEVPVSTFAAAPRNVNDLTNSDNGFNIKKLLDKVALQEPSSAFTLAPDYVALFKHIEQTAQERPTVSNLRVYIVISDFSIRRGEAGHESGLPIALLDRLASLRRTLVTRGNQRLLAIRTQPRQEPSPALHNDLVGEIARNFALVEDGAQISTVMDELLGGEPPLLLGLDFNPQTAVYSLTVANPSCTAQQSFQYYAIAAGIDLRLALPGCPTALRPGETGTCQFAPAQIVLPPLPDTCLNVWLRAKMEEPVAPAVPPRDGEVLGTTNDPILVGNCVFLSRVDLDSTKSLTTAQELAECRRTAEAAGNVPADAFVACLRLRGRVEGDAARLRVRRGIDAAAPLLVDHRLPEAVLNGAAFHGGERMVPVGFSLPQGDASWLCSPEVDLAKRRLAVEIVGTGGVLLASGILGRVLPPTSEDPLALWRKLLAPLLILLFLSGFVANYMKTASLGMLDAVLLVLGLGLLMLLFAAYGGSGVGSWLSSLFGASSLVVATIGIGFLAVCYWLLFTRGFFDRQLTAQGRAALSLRMPLAERRRQRSFRTWLALGLALLLIASTVVLLWLNPREVSECRYQLTDLPTNTAVPPFNQPVVSAAPAPAPTPVP
jgi:hypothetical protein